MLSCCFVVNTECGAICWKCLLYSKFFLQYPGLRERTYSIFTLGNNVRNNVFSGMWMSSQFYFKSQGGATLPTAHVDDVELRRVFAKNSVTKNILDIFHAHKHYGRLPVFLSQGRYSFNRLTHVRELKGFKKKKKVRFSWWNIHLWFGACGSLFIFVSVTFPTISMRNCCSWV